MGFLEFIAVVLILYFIITITLWCVLDSDIELFFMDMFGHRISALRGKVVWVTGASSGIGKGLALHLAKNGVKLVISARRTNLLEEVKSECIRLSNGSLTSNDILVLEMDMLQIQQHELKLNTVLQHFGHLDILVNNAGRSQRAAWNDVSLNVDRELFEIDVFSIVNLTRLAVKYFEKHKIAGQVAVTSSGCGLVGLPFSPSYCGGKFAIHGYYESLRVEKPHVAVTLFCPGPIATGFLEEAFTGTQGEKYNKSVQPTDKRMTYDRCGYLFAVALANKIPLTWAGLFPVSVLLYVSLYCPLVHRIVSKLLPASRMNKVREGK